MDSRWDRAIKAGKIETPILSCKNGVQSDLLRGRACMMFVAMLRDLTLRKQNIIVSLALVSLLMMFDDNGGRFCLFLRGGLCCVCSWVQVASARRF